MSNYFHTPNTKRIEYPATKIIATLGPSTDDRTVLSQIIEAGVSVVRINCSHGTHAEHARRIQLTRECAREKGRVVGIMADLQGPKIRIAKFKSGPVFLVVGETFILDAEMDADGGTNECVGIDYKNLPQDVTAGDTLVLDDGRITLEVNRIENKKIICTVLVGGRLSDHKGINRLGGGLSAKALTEKDIHDLRFAIGQNVDYIAVSFPQDAADILEAQRLIKEFGGHAGVVAKIERAEAINNLQEIIKASDGVMVARGDLAVEIGDANVPVMQKKIIHLARIENKPVITATQMMESMISSTIPTRAEVSDVANAVLDYTDAVMLSAESAVGDHPVMVVKTMARTCLAAERDPSTQVSRHRVELRFQRVDEAIAMATMYTANHLDITGVIAITESGTTPLWMSRIRTGIPIYGLSRNATALGRMTLYRGVYPVAFDITQHPLDEVNNAAINTLRRTFPIPADSLVILTKGDQMGVGGGTNAMKIIRVR